MGLMTAAIIRGERMAQAARPAVLTYADDEVPCCPGNLDFFQRLKADGGGFENHQGLFVKILRCDIPTSMMSAGFKSGHQVTVTDLTSGDQDSLVIGENNSWQPEVLILNLEKVVA